ncbi:L-serine ammonia-lyase, partial [Paracoccaceae bacterium]|nr:L-serine ammonia-lyase [Paracoccaceae bacterium]
MFLSVFDMFKIGIGPSSSHTMGPMVAANRFLETLKHSPFNFSGIRVTLYGSLAFTGKGHATDHAIILGLAGFSPENYDREAIEKVLLEISDKKFIISSDLGKLSF